MCRWPVIPAPATLPRFIPTLNPPGAPPLLPPDAEDAPGPARAVPPDPLHPPGREHPFHRKRSAVDQFPQFLADFEEGDPLLGDGDFLPGLGVASLLGPAEADGETAESPDLDLLPPVQGVPHVMEDRVHEDLALLLGQRGYLLRQRLHQIALRHPPSPPGILF